MPSRRATCPCTRRARSAEPGRTPEGSTMTDEHHPDDERYLMVSADGHAGPPASIYRSYLEPRYRDRFDAHQAELEALRALTNTTDAGFAARFQEESGDGGLLAAYDSAARIEKLDGEGVAVEVLFPDADVLGTGRVASSPFGSGLASGRDNEPELVLAGARAHNRWLA